MKHNENRTFYPFPEQIVILPLLQTTNSNDLVLDAFHGYGTTGKVSIQYE
jgi:adenine specific DNA methylase Mod